MTKSASDARTIIAIEKIMDEGAVVKADVTAVGAFRVVIGMPAPSGDIAPTYTGFGNSFPEAFYDAYERVTEAGHV